MRALAVLAALALSACVTPVHITTGGQTSLHFRIGGVRIVTDARAMTSVATGGVGIVHTCGTTAVGAHATWCVTVPAPQPKGTKP